MDKLIALIFDIVIAVIISFVAVVIYFGLRSEPVIRAMDQEITENFLSDMKEKGSMTTTDYEKFMYKLSLTGILYDVFLEHKFSVLEPEYRMRSIEEIIAAQKAAYKGDNIYHYKDVITQIPNVIDPIDNSGLTMNTETNESVLAGAINSPSTGHIHTDECYGGHRHSSIYGTLDMKNEPVYMDLKSNGSSYSGYYDTRVSFGCAVCGRELYAIAIGKYIADYTQYVSIAMETFTYSQYLSSPTVNYRMVYAKSHEQGAALRLQFNSYIDYALNHGAVSAQNGRSNAFVFPYPGYPGWNAAGDMNYSTFTGCSNIKAHPNPDACYPVGKKTKVNFRVQGYKDTMSTAYVRYITINCADCGSELLRTYVVFGPFYNQGERLRSQLESDFYEYNETGQIVGTYKNSLMDLIPNAPATLQPFIHFDQENIGVAGEIQNLYNKYYGNGVIAGTDNNYYSITPIDYPFPGIPTRRGSFDVFPVLWEPFRGCPYCGTYGSAYSCGKESAISCDKIIQSIVPTHPVQSVYTNEVLITTVKATYLDGSTKVLLASTSYSTGTPVLNKIVTLSLTDGLGTTKTCNITINVVPRFKICANGHTYNLNTDGSDPGCVFCHAYVSNIRVTNPITSAWTITIGSSLADNGLKILVTYLDGHTETINEGYEDNLDKQYLGTKMVTIGYKGVTTQLLVTTVCAKMTCDICGFVYELYPDGTNPGCPKCISKTPVFTGNILEYEAVNYTEDLLEDLYEDGIYQFNKDDTILITVNNKSSTLVRNLLRKVYPNMSKQWLHMESSETIQSK